jgi:hypothetical protein
MMKSKIAIAASLALLLAVFLSISCLPKLRASEMVKDIEGIYRRETNDERAKLEFRLLPDGKVHVAGIAFWGTRREYGPNIGELDFTSALLEDRISYSEKKGQRRIYTLELTFTKDGLTAREEGHSDNLGLNVSFAGEYKKTGAIVEKDYFPNEN